MTIISSTNQPDDMISPDTDRMNPEVKAKWIEALTSGEYSQTNGCLKDNAGYCCLGVLTDLYIKETGQAQWVPGITYASMKGAVEGVHSFTKNLQVTTAEAAWDARDADLIDTTLPDAVKSWAGLDDGRHMNKYRKVSRLIRMNDGDETQEVRRHSFVEIAEYIKENL